MEKMKMHSKNITQEQIEKLMELFPGCVTESVGTIHEPEGAIHELPLRKTIDWDLLKQELSGHIVEGPQERYRLDWPGKREALLTANTPIAKTLRPCREESVDFDTTENLFIEGDNLDALKLLQETYLGKVKMIYIDPPYNTGKDFIYKDKFSVDTEQWKADSGDYDDEGNRLVANTESNGRFHSDWLSMMYPRLKLARNLLRDDGVIFISIDDGEVANLQRACNELYGQANHYCTFVWKRRSGAMDSVNNISSDHEYVLCYGKQQGKLNGVKRTYERYKNPDNDPRGSWIADNLSAGKPGGNTYYPIIDPDKGNEYWPPKGRYWPYSPDTMEQKIKEGRIIFPKNTDGSPLLKRFQNEAKSDVVPISTWGVDTHSKVSNAFITALNTEGTKEIKQLFGNKIFTFPKPTQLIKSLIHQGTNDNDIILDFFAGSSVTAHAVMQLNAEDLSACNAQAGGGKRKFIMVQLPEPCDEKSEAFKAGYKTIAEIAKERIRRAGKQIVGAYCNTPIQSNTPIRNDNTHRQREIPNQSPIDTGFRVLKVDSSNMADVYYRPDAITQNDLFNNTDNIKPDRTAEDLLFQVLLDWGVDLTLPITQQNVGAIYESPLPVYFVDGNALAACFETDGKITEDFCRVLARREPLRVVFRDAGFAGDAVKINVEQIFKLMSPHTEIKTL